MQTRSILVVDDDESMLEYCAGVMAIEGFQVQAVSNAKDAVSVIRSTPFDIVLTDHVVVEPGSQSMTQAVKLLRPDTEVIVMTALPTLENAVNSFVEGACDYLVKPFKLEQLRSAVGRGLEKRRAREALVFGQEGMEWLKKLVDAFFLKAGDRGPGSARAWTDAPVIPGVEGRLVSLMYELAMDFRRRIAQDAKSQGFDWAQKGNAGLEIAAEATEKIRPVRSYGRYEIIRELARGSMGLVYLCRDPKINRLLAVKTMRFDLGLEAEPLAEVKARFFREAESAGKLAHPNIVKIFDVGEQDDSAYIAMELLEGENLSRVTQAGSLVSVGRALRYAATIAGTLDYAHRQGVVHRDIKPANIIRRNDDADLCITDFGIARLESASATAFGFVMGTPYYMSPEQIAGKKVDGRTDLFALGVVLYELLAGSKPWERGDTIESLLYRVANEPHQDILSLRPELGAPIARVINKALMKDPERRYQNGRVFADDLEELLKNS